MPTRVIRTSVVKILLMLFACIGMIGLLALIPAEGGAILPRNWAIGLLIAVVLIFGLVLSRPPKVTFSARYFEIQGAWGAPQRTYWTDVESISIWRNPAPRSFQTLVRWTLRPESAAAPELLRAARRMIGASGTLPQALTLSISELEALMRRYWQAALAAAPDRPEPTRD